MCSLLDRSHSTIFHCFHIACVQIKVSNAKVKSNLERQKVNYQEYLTVYSPSTEWILQCLCEGQSKDFLSQVFDKLIEASTENRPIKYDPHATVVPS